MRYVYGKRIKTLRERLTTGLASLAILANCMGASLPFLFAKQASAITPYNQSFEASDSGWIQGGQYGTLQRVVSGTDGIASASGGYHAIVNEAGGSGPYTNFAGRSNIWTGTWTAKVDVYLDPSWPAGSGFDYTVSASKQDGSHLRDFIFHVTKDTSTGKLLVAGSNNSNPNLKEDLETVNHYEVTSAGWYTLRHTFRDQAGALAADLQLLNSSGSILFTETRSTASDLIANVVGGNRYGWFVNVVVPGGLAIDNVELSGSPAPVVNVTTGEEFATIKAAIQDTDTANGHIIEVNGSLEVNENTTINKSVTIRGNAGATITTSNSTQLFTVTASGTTFENLSFVKTDNSTAQNFIGVQASDVSILNSSFTGQFVVPSTGATTRGIVVSSGANNLLIEGNTFNNLRQPAYLNNFSGGTIKNNHVNGTRGWVVEKASHYTFEGNTWGANQDDTKRLDIAVIPGASPESTPNNYPCEVMAAITANNNGAVIENQSLTTPCPPANTVVTVTNLDTKGWGGAVEKGNGSHEFENGPDTSPAGSGSLKLSIAGSDDGYVFGRGGFEGIRLDEIAVLSYNTYKVSGDHAVSPALQLNFDNDVTDTDNSWKGRLVYEPYLANGGSVPAGSWQNWDALAGKGWFLSNSGLATASGCTMDNPCTWAQVRAAFPNGGINKSEGFVFFKVGSGWSAGFTGNIDAFTFATSAFNTTYDFEYDASNTGPSVSFVDPTPTEGSFVSGSFTPHVLASDDYGMGSYYIRLWKGAFESGNENLVVNNCWAASGAFNLGSTLDISCPSIDTTTLEDGTYVLSAQFLDGHGVWGQALRTIKIDNSYPSFAIISPANSSHVSGEITVQAEVKDASDITKLIVSGAGSHNWTNGVSSTITRTGDIFSFTLDTRNLPDGPVWITLRATDGAGNTRYWNNNAANRQHVFYVDNNKPTITVNTPDWSINPTVLSVTATDTVQLKQVTSHVYDESASSLVKNCSIDVSSLNTAAYTHTCNVTTMGLSDGVYTIKANARDMANWLSNTDSSVKFIIDYTKPEIEIENVSVSQDNKLSFDLTAFDATSGLKIVAANIYDETNTNKILELGNGTPTRLNLPHSGLPLRTHDFAVSISDVDLSGLDDGIYTIRAYAVDHAGNELRFKLVQFAIDNTPPTLTLDPIPSNSSTSRVISGTTEPFANVEVTVHSTPQTKTTTADSSGNWSVTFDGLSVGSHNVTVTSRDAANNEATLNSSFSVTSTAFVAGVSTNTPNSNASYNGNASQTGRNNAAGRGSANGNSNNSNNGQVLAAETTVDDLPTDTDVRNEVQSQLDQARDVAMQGQEASDASSGAFLGLAWWLWLIILAIIGGVLYLIFRPRNQE